MGRLVGQKHGGKGVKWDIFPSRGGVKPYLEAWDRKTNSAIRFYVKNGSRKHVKRPPKGRIDGDEGGVDLKIWLGGHI